MAEHSFGAGPECGFWLPTPALRPQTGHFCSLALVCSSVKWGHRPPPPGCWEEFAFLAATELRCACWLLAGGNAGSSVRSTSCTCSSSLIWPWAHTPLGRRGPASVVLSGELVPLEAASPPPWPDSLAEVARGSFLCEPLIQLISLNPLNNPRRWVTVISSFHR